MKPTHAPGRVAQYTRKPCFVTKCVYPVTAVISTYMPPAPDSQVRTPTVSDNHTSHTAANLKPTPVQPIITATSYTPTSTAT